MIRNVVLIRLKPGNWEDRIDEFDRAMRAVTYRGMTGFWLGRDAGLRDGNADVAVVCDFEDEDAYREYDTEPEHNRIRREIVAPIAEHVERCQFVI